MTPLELMYLLDAYCHADGAKATNDPAKSFEARCLMNRVIDALPNGYHRTTDLGKAWVNAVLLVPVPEVRYLDELGRVVLHKPGPIL